MGTSLQNAALSARRASGLTQSEVAARVGTTQSAIARLERPGANPRLETLQRVVNATGHRLRVELVPAATDVDERQIESHLRMTPAERAAHHDASYRNVRETLVKARGGS